MTSSTQLEEWGHRHIGPGFLGVFMSDETAAASSALWNARRQPGPKSLIFNYDPRSKGGSHWVAVRIDESGFLDWIDSYGLAPDADDKVLRDKTKFRQWCEAESRHGRWAWNQLDLQSIEGTTCGQYSLWSCLHGMPDPRNPAWAPVFEAGGEQPPVIKNGLLGLRKVNQHAAKLRDEEIKRLVGI